MRKLLPLLAFFVLAACAAGESRASFRLTYDITDATLQEQLSQMALKVVENRLSRGNIELKDATFANDGSGRILTIALPNAVAVEQLTYELTQPFTFRLVREIPAAASGATTASGETANPQGTFVETGITEDDLYSAEWADDNGIIAVRLLFNDAGKAKLRELAPTVKGQVLGILVRDLLISKTQGDDLKEDIIIRGVPSIAIAEVFTYDMNVGAHVTFTPLP